MRCVLLPLLPAAGLLLAADLAFAPTEGATVTKRFEERTSWTLDSVSQTVAGEEQPVEGLDDFTGEFERLLEFVDTYSAVAEGELRGLRRQVSVAAVSAIMALEIPAGTLYLDFDAASDLEDEVIVFTVDAESGDVSAELESDRQPAALDGVALDADLLALLPGGDGREGDAWSVDPEALASLFMPGGDLSLLPDSASELPGDGMETTDLLAAGQLALAYPFDVRDGSVDAQWVGTVEDEGRELIRVELTVDLELESDRSELLARMVETAGVDSAREDVELDLQWSLEGEGELLWDAGAGRFDRLTLTLEGTADVAQTWNQPVGGGQTLPVEIVAELSTRTVLSASAR